MIVKVSEANLGQDPAVAEMIKVLDHPSKFNPEISQRENFEKLKRIEIEAISNEIAHCQDDFIYAARNYFWIQTKQGEDVLLKLNEPQSMILEKLYWLWASKRLAKIMIIKSRQLGCSTLVEALIAWRTMFFPNTNSLVVSNVPAHAQYLFGIMLHIYDQMPWWLKPDWATRTYDSGLTFDNPDPKMRRTNPGLHSRIDVQAATQMSGIGQGIRLNAVHVSEFTDFLQDVASDCIEGDMKEALAEADPLMFAILESTGKGAGTYSHRLWLKNVDLGDEAEWHPTFLPWFFDKKHVLPPPDGWKIPKEETAMAKRVYTEWARCDNQRCAQWREAIFRGESVLGTKCPVCSIGTLEPYLMTAAQLRWMWNRRINAEKDAKSLKTLREEQCSTAEEAFQVSGFQVFPQDCIEYVISNVRKPLAVGDFDAQGRFHGVKHFIKGPDGKPIGSKCYQEWCNLDHTWDRAPLEVWKFPEPGESYVVGGDVSEGIGQDYSVGWVNKLGGRNGAPDEHVALYRRNDLGGSEFAVPLNFLGRWYNEALMSIEYNMFPGCANDVAMRYMYPNLFRWKHYDSERPLSHKWHWNTQANTKPLLWQTAVKFFRQRIWVIHSNVFAEEMKTFQKEDFDDRSGSADTGFYDDCIMAGCIALFTSHDMDYDENLGYVVTNNSDVSVLVSANFEATCPRCKHKWYMENPDSGRGCECDDCRHKDPRTGRSERGCGCMIISARRSEQSNEMLKEIDIEKELNSVGRDEYIESESYDAL